MMRPPLRIGVVGCGDVFHRSYLPALAILAPTEVVVAACCDIRADAVERTVLACRLWAGEIQGFTDHRALAEGAPLDAAFNLTPAPEHGGITVDLVGAGINVFSEKPLANTREDTDHILQRTPSKGAPRPRAARLGARGSGADRRLA